MAASMFDDVFHHVITPQRLPRMRTQSGFRNGQGTIENLPVSYSTHEKTSIQQDGGVCIFLGIGCGGRNYALTFGIILSSFYC